MKIAKSFTFDAAHWLPNVAPDHKCHRMHGHTYRVEIACSGKLDERGMVCDYAEIAEAWRVAEAEIDHRVLNEVPGLENPTTEVLALWIVGHLCRALLSLASVRVYESSSSWCEVEWGKP